MIIEFERLPDLAAVGGNARPGHYMEAYRSRSGKRGEKEVWLALIREKWLPHEMPKFQKARAAVTLIFAESRRRDVQDNIPMSLKSLWDAFVFWEILPDDSPSYFHLEPIQIEVDPTRAPRTIIDLEEVS